MFFHNDGMGYGQSLPRTLARFLCSKEKIEYFVPNFFRDAGAGIVYIDFCPIVLPTGADADRTQLGRVVFVCFRDGVSGIAEANKANPAQRGTIRISTRREDNWAKI